MQRINRTLNESFSWEPTSLSVVCMCRGGSVKGQSELWGWSSGGILSTTKVCDLLVPGYTAVLLIWVLWPGSLTSLVSSPLSWGGRPSKLATGASAHLRASGPCWLWWKRPSVPRLVGGPQGPRASAGLPRVSRKSRCLEVEVSVFQSDLRNDNLSCLSFSICLKSCQSGPHERGGNYWRVLCGGPWEEI